MDFIVSIGNIVTFLHVLESVLGVTDEDLVSPVQLVEYKGKQNKQQS
jgi:hypothetical protein